MRLWIVWGTMLALTAVACSREEAPQPQKAPPSTEVRSATVKPKKPTPEELQALQKECESNVDRMKSDPRCDQFQDVH